MCRRKASKTPQFFSSGEGGMRPNEKVFLKLSETVLYGRDALN